MPVYAHSSIECHSIIHFIMRETKSINGFLCCKNTKTQKHKFELRRQEEKDKFCSDSYHTYKA